MIPANASDPKMMQRSILSEDDIKRLVKSENVDDRAVATHKICRSMEKADLSERDRAAAQEIIRMLARDAAELVRRALAVTLRTSELLPRDVALKLAQDVTSVAIPVISHSPIFTDEDLKAIVLSGGAVRQVAIAKRDSLSEVVTDALAQHGVEEAVVIACANDNARFTDQGFGEVMDRFGKSEIVQNVLVHRHSIPIALSERLISVVNAQLREHLVKHHALSADTAMKLTEASRERATLDMADQSGSQHDPAKLAKHLMQASRLTPSLMLRALGRGHMAFFEHALSELSQVPHERTWLMVHDAGTLGFRAIYDRAGLPSRLFQTFKIAIETHHALMDEGAEWNPIRFQTRMIERFLTQVPFAPREDLVYLYERLDMAMPKDKGSEASLKPLIKAA